MVALKSKIDKHVADNEKRRKSLKEKEKAKINQSQIIKQALSNAASNNSGKKIVFSDNEDNDELGCVNNKIEGNLNGAEKLVLFDNLDSENEEFEIKEKFQFSGKKGFELLNLQSTYGNDERFKIDDRFIEKDATENEKETTNTEENIAEEKAQQLKILESVLGIPMTQPKPEKKSKKRVYEMVRYDANNKDHEIHEVSSDSKTIETPPKKRKEKKDKVKTPKIDLVPKTNVSKEKFYEVSGEIKNAFKNKKEENQSFSLLQAYAGRNDANIPEEEEEEEEEDVEDVEEKYYEDEKNFLNEEMMDQTIDWSDEEVTEESKVEDKKVNKEKNDSKPKVAKAMGIWKEPFFFEQDDERFIESLEFINKKNSTEASEASASYNEKRRKLREILRLFAKKQMLKNNPFKHKVGGMNKKQLMDTKYKKNKSDFKTKKPNKKKNSKV